ncbi:MULTISPECIES: CGNR zinc finger domain-containing protein [Amycolatopsis]|uniref:CGNR zinc finger domain-containing protein n=1 Tax=Amycolatopsis TaxID=1813 RepID=UPI000B87324E|nr:CGNR zinc finger domain-containing protein [Amycolatopsis sacchari]
MASDDASLVVDFLNTVDIERGLDALADAAKWRQWTEERGLGADPLPFAREVRESLRAAVGDPHAEPARLTVPLAVELTTGRPALAATNAVAAVLAAAVRLTVRDDWERVKICLADDCRWAFFDQSRNRSRTWCSMRVCGNREKARAWRERRSPSNELPTDQPVDNSGSVDN